MTSSKEYFEKRRLPVVERLPKFYGALASSIDPDFPTKRLYNTVQGAVIDWEALELLKKVAKKYGVKKSK